MVWVALAVFAVAGALAAGALVLRKSSQPLPETNGLQAEVGGQELPSQEPDTPIPTTTPATKAYVPTEMTRTLRVPGLVTVVGSNGEEDGGVFVAEDGAIVTTSAVVGDSDHVEIRSPTGEVIVSQTVSKDPRSGLALVRVNALVSEVLGKGSGLTVERGSAVSLYEPPLSGNVGRVLEGQLRELSSVNGVFRLRTDIALGSRSLGAPVVDSQGRLVGIVAMVPGDSAPSIVAIDHADRLLSLTPAAAIPTTASQVLPPPAREERQGETDVDRTREVGIVRFERAMAVLAAKADQADIAWNRYVEGCHLEVTSTSAAAAAGGRAWFVFAWASTTTTRPTDACAEAGTFVALVGQVKAGMCVAEEQARKAWVYPGARRDIRTRYRLDWDGWDRVCQSR